MKTVFSLNVTVVARILISTVGVVPRLADLVLVAYLLPATFVSRFFRLAAETSAHHNG